MDSDASQTLAVIDSMNFPDAAKTYFNSLIGLARMKNAGKYSVQQRRRNRLLWVKWMPCLVPHLMSSEESEDGDEEQMTFRVRPLFWRSEKVTAFFAKLDQ